MPAHPDLIVWGARVRTLDAILMAISDEDVSGRVKPGYRADLTGFAADPVDIAADALLALPILITMVDGRVVNVARELNVD